MIKAIIFDYGGVIAKEGHLGAFCKKFSSKYKVDSKEFYSMIIKLWNNAKIDKIPSKKFWQDSANYLNINENKLRKDVLKFFKENKNILKLIKKLKPNYKLAILSNQIRDWLEEEVKRLKLDKIMDEISGSYDAKIAKPNIKFYKDLIKKLKVKPEEAVLIENQEKNILPAKKLGINTILIKNISQVKKELKKLNIKV